MYLAVCVINTSSCVYDPTQNWGKVPASDPPPSNSKRLSQELSSLTGHGHSQEEKVSQEQSSQNSQHSLPVSLMESSRKTVNHDRPRSKLYIAGGECLRSDICMYRNPDFKIAFSVIS